MRVLPGLRYNSERHSRAILGLRALRAWAADNLNAVALGVLGIMGGSGDGPTLSAGTEPEETE